MERARILAFSIIFQYMFLLFTCFVKIIFCLSSYFIVFYCSSLFSIIFIIFIIFLIFYDFSSCSIMFAHCSIVLIVFHNLSSFPLFSIMFLTYLTSARWLLGFFGFMAFLACWVFGFPASSISGSAVSRFLYLPEVVYSCIGCS